MSSVNINFKKQLKSLTDELFVGKTKLVLIVHPTAPKRIALISCGTSIYSQIRIWIFLEENNNQWNLCQNMSYIENKEDIYWDITDSFSINITI